MGDIVYGVIMWKMLWIFVIEDGLCGWVGIFEDVEKIRKVYEVDLFIIFVLGKKEVNFGRLEIGNVIYMYFCMFIL